MKTKLLFIFLIFSSNLLFSQDIRSEFKAKYSAFSNGDILISPDYNYKTGNFSKSQVPYEYSIVGVFFDDNTDDSDIRKLKNPVKLTGVVSVKYNLENGPIKIGDPVTSSSVPGEAMKATQSGMIIGIALEDANTSSGLLKVRVMIQYLNF